MIRFALMGVVACAATSANAVTFLVRAEAPGVQTSLANLRPGSGVETFNTQSTSTNIFTSTFGGSSFSGEYKGVIIRNANQFGGAGGNTRYADIDKEAGYTLTFTGPNQDNVNYFGMWWSALDKGNEVKFYKDGKVIYTFGATEYRALLQGSGSSIPAGYFGNPNAAFAGQNRAEPYAFINFYAMGGATFDKILFRETPQAGGFETDNHTVGQWLTTEPVPEPATWAMLIAGFGLVGAMRRRAGLATA
jgi:hypothetical protein